MPSAVKPDRYRNHRSVAELAQYVGVTARTVERWAADALIPECEHRTKDGMKLWSQEQCAEILEFRLRKLPSRQREARRITPQRRKS
jgi:DNA-binding transcriptional MerR regulator